jgi:hypothetical protein
VIFEPGLPRAAEVLGQSVAAERHEVDGA